MDEAALAVAESEELYKSEMELYGLKAILAGCIEPTYLCPGWGSAARRCC